LATTNNNGRFCFDGGIESYSFEFADGRLGEIEMLSHDEMVGLQSEKHDLIDPEAINNKDAFVLHLIHSFAYHKAKDLVEGQTVLDLGCNTGYGSFILSHSAREVLGVDVSEGAIAAAKSKYQVANLQFSLIDGKRLPFSDGVFDVVISCQVIEHIVDYEVFLGEIKRVLSPTGLVILTTPNALIRLDPGMKPWNPFHVVEFDDVRLRTLLSKHFKSVASLGLFAGDDLYRNERRRTSRARRNARRERNFFSRRVNRLYLATTKQLRSFCSELFSSRAKKFSTRFNFDDLFYQSSDLHDALDLMALCSNHPGQLAGAVAHVEKRPSLRFSTSARP
jgi:2-polyprenyl-3-methyl-5-hydroxy-6-metoxy-1,4-benzoquinol methylase